MTFITLVSGASSAAREQAIAERLVCDIRTVAILEGFPSGNPALENQAQDSYLEVIRIAAGCMCCTGNLVLKVTLNRVLRIPPQQIFLAIADASHVEQLRSFLKSDSYVHLLSLTEDCSA